MHMVLYLVEKLQVCTHLLAQALQALLAALLCC